MADKTLKCWYNAAGTHGRNLPCVLEFAGTMEGSVPIHFVIGRKTGLRPAQSSVAGSMSGPYFARLMCLDHSLLDQQFQVALNILEGRLTAIHSGTFAFCITQVHFLISATWRHLMALYEHRVSTCGNISCIWALDRPTGGMRFWGGIPGCQRPVGLLTAQT
jgi:hypothetical protein